MTFRWSARLLLVLVMLSTGLDVARAQELAVAKPRFRATWVPAGQPNDASGLSVLQRRVSLDLVDVPMVAALREVASQARLDLSYDKAVLPQGRLVSLRAQGLTVVAALTEILVQSGLDVAVGRGGQLALVRKPAPVVADSGSIAGRITDKATGAAIVGATVVVDGTSLRAESGQGGNYRLGRVPTGTYTVRARYIGYTPATAVVTVGAEQEAVAEFGLERSTQRLDEVVTTGTVVPTEVKALPVPITVITAEQIEQQHIRRMDQIFRQAVPGAIGWDLGTDVDQTFMSVRGASTLVNGQGTLKVYVDGLEVANRTWATVDPASIERVEVIRGPQAAAIYGSDAIGGVMQIFTKRGDPALTRPQVEMQAAVGTIQSPYEGSGALQQQYRASVKSGAGPASFHIGGAYTHSGEWVDDYSVSAPSIFGGIHLTQNQLVLDLSARYSAPKMAVPLSPRLRSTGYAGYQKPFYMENWGRTETYGARLSYSPIAWWQHSAVLGIDRHADGSRQTQPRLTTPTDTLLYVFQRNVRKTSIGYTTTVQAPLGPGLSATLIAGADHYRYDQDYFGTPGALVTTGSIATDPGQPVMAAAYVTTNTGYFAQAQLGVRDALFLTGAIRGDQNSEFGDSVGLQVSPRAGVAYVQHLAPVTVKVRASYGKAIQLPSSGAKYADQTSSTLWLLANPNLRPEQQAGWDAGVDLAFGTRGTLGVTHYNQRARDLIQFTAVDVSSIPLLYQFQNIGRARNTGWEFEGALRDTRWELTAQFAITRSRIEDLGTTYTGDLQVGDAALGIPTHTAGASLTVAPWLGTSVSAGLTYVGERTYYDWLAYYSCFGGTAPCRGPLRDYWTTYSGFAKVNVSVNQRFTRLLSAFIAVENLTNSSGAELDNATLVPGRITTIGAKFTY